MYLVHMLLISYGKMIVMNFGIEWGSRAGTIAGGLLIISVFAAAMLAGRLDVAIHRTLKRCIHSTPEGKIE